MIRYSHPKALGSHSAAGCGLRLGINIHSIPFHCPDDSTDKRKGAMNAQIDDDMACTALNTTLPFHKVGINGPTFEGHSRGVRDENTLAAACWDVMRSSRGRTGIARICMATDKPCEEARPRAALGLVPLAGIIYRKSEDHRSISATGWAPAYLEHWVLLLFSIVEAVSVSTPRVIRSTSELLHQRGKFSQQRGWLIGASWRGSEFFFTPPPPFPTSSALIDTSMCMTFA
ncbi:hypothetical protein ACQKWADRAFT_105281 [Trichoderma austrokoningii]